MRGEAHEPARQRVDRVVRRRPGAVSAVVGDLELERQVHLLARLDFEHDVAAVERDSAARIGVERELGLADEMPALGHEPADPRAVRLLVGGERHDPVAIGGEPVAPGADQVEDEERRAGLVVRGAAAVPPAVLLDERERVRGPVFAQSGDDVQVGEHEEGRPLSGAGQPRDQHLRAVGPGDLGFDPRRLEPGGRDGQESLRVLTPRHGRDLDHLGVDLRREQAVLGARRGLSGGCGGTREQGSESERHEPHRDAGAGSSGSGGVCSSR